MPTFVRYALVCILCCCFFGLPARAENWALLVGIDEYRDTNHITGLGGAAADARAIKNVLVQKMGFSEEHIDLLVSRDAGRSDLLAALTRLKTRATEGDFVFVFFAGHGMEIKGRNYLLPYDTAAASDDDIIETALDIARFQERLREVKAQMVFLCFDMCRSNPIKGSRDATAENPLTEQTVRSLDYSKAVTGQDNKNTDGATSSNLAVTLYACSPGERAYEDRLRSRGFFSRFLEVGLEGAAADDRGHVTVDSLLKYLSVTVPREVLQNVGGKAKQTPYPIPAGSGVGSFVLVKGAIPEVNPVAPNPTPSNRDARLAVTTNVPGAVVTVRGEPVQNGIYLVTVPDASTMQVDVIAQADGYEPARKTVTLTRGTTTKVELLLEPVPHVNKPTPPPSNAPQTPALTVTELLQLPVPRTLDEYKRQMVSIPAGVFRMGSADGKNDEKPVRDVTLSPFLMGRTPVTVAMWKDYCLATKKPMPLPPDGEEWVDEHPMVNISWEDATAYCAWAKLSLPTEAQWEYAARGGAETAYPWGKRFETARLVCEDNAEGKTAPVYRRARIYINNFGLVDMVGNVYQWCADWYGPYTGAAVRDPGGPIVGKERVVRGGSWNNSEARDFRTSARSRLEPATASVTVGFRCVVP